MTGTDTGIGKTAVTCGILRALRQRGVDVGAFKPAESGFDGRPGAWPTDGRCLATSAGLSDGPAAVVPYVFRNALAPQVAAEVERVRIEPHRITAALRTMRAAHSLTLVEGAGGLMVPLTRRVTMADLAQRWKLPILVVARAGLGTINHTVLTTAHARKKKLKVLGVVINNYPEKPGLVEKTNPQVIERMTGVPVLGIIPHVPNVDVEAGRVEAMAKAVEDHLDLDPIMRLAGRKS